MHMEGGRGCHLQHTQGVVHAHLHLRRLLPSAVLLMRARGHPEVAAAAAALAAALPHSRRIDVVRSSRNHAPQQHRPHHQRASAQPRHRSGEADGHPVGVFGLRGRRSAASYATDEAVRVVCRYACPHLSLTEGPSRRAPRSSAVLERHAFAAGCSSGTSPEGRMHADARERRVRVHAGADGLRRLAAPGASPSATPAAHARAHARHPTRCVRQHPCE